MTSILPHLKQEDSPIACPLSIAKTWISEWLNQNQLYFLDHSHLRGIDASPVLALHEMSDSFPLAWDRLSYGAKPKSAASIHSHLRGIDGMSLVPKKVSVDSFPLAWDRH